MDLKQKIAEDLQRFEERQCLTKSSKNFVEKCQKSFLFRAVNRDCKLAKNIQLENVPDCRHHKEKNVRTSSAYEDLQVSPEEYKELTQHLAENLYKINEGLSSVNRKIKETIRHTTMPAEEAANLKLIQTKIDDRKKQQKIPTLQKTRTRTRTRTLLPSSSKNLSVPYSTYRTIPMSNFPKTTKIGGGLTEEVAEIQTLLENITDLLDESFYIYTESPETHRIVVYTKEHFEYLDGTEVNIHPADPKANPQLVDAAKVYNDLTFYNEEILRINLYIVPVISQFIIALGNSSEKKSSENKGGSSRKYKTYRRHFKAKKTRKRRRL